MQRQFSLARKPLWLVDTPQSQQCPTLYLLQILQEWLNKFTDSERAMDYVMFIPIGAVTIDQKGTQLAELSAMHQSEAGVRIFSDDGHCVADPLVMLSRARICKNL